jgi:hypothetical protein
MHYVSAKRTIGRGFVTAQSSLSGIVPDVNLTVAPLVCVCLLVLVPLTITTLTTHHLLAQPTLTADSSPRHGLG